MTATAARRVAQRYASSVKKAALLTRRDPKLQQLIAWIGPQALRAFKSYPRGQQSFDTESRQLVFNIAPEDYFEWDHGEVGLRAPSVLGVNPEAFDAMQGFIRDLKRKRIPFKVEHHHYEMGGSLLLAKLPRPKEPPVEEPSKGKLMGKPLYSSSWE